MNGEHPNSPASPTTDPMMQPCRKGCGELVHLENDGFHVCRPSHTPGPWVCFYKHKYDEWHVGVPLNSGGGMKVALFPNGCPTHYPQGDCYLIAAAPDLLAALRELLAAQLTQIPPFEAGKEAQDAWADRRATARNNAAAAIAKAEGRS